MTPTQIALHEAHKARQARFTAAAQFHRKAKLPPVIIEGEPDPAVIIEWPRKPLCEVVTDIVAGPEPVTVDKIKRAVCRHFGINKAALGCQDRTKAFVTPRHIAMYLCRKLTTRSHHYIGHMIGNRDHSVVVHSVKKITKLIEKDPEIASIVAKLEAEIAPSALEVEQ